MNLRDVQLEHRTWLNHNFPNQTIEQTVLGMVEEVGELAHHLLKRAQGIRGDGVDHEAEIKDALADFIIFAMDLADREGFIIEDAVIEVWEQVRERDWVKFPHDGRTR